MGPDEGFVELLTEGMYEREERKGVRLNEELIVYHLMTPLWIERNEGKRTYRAKEVI